MPTQTAPPTASLLSSLDALGEVDPSSLSGSEQADLLRALGQAEARICAVKLKLLAAADRAGTARAFGAAGTGQWAAKVTNLDQAATHRQVGLASGLAQRPTTAQALAEGALSAEHAEVIVRATRLLPETVTETQREQVEADLVAKAATLPPRALRRAARRALTAVEPDERKVDAHENGLVADEEAVARQSARLTLRDNDDGSITGHFTIPGLHGQLLRKVLEAMTAPRTGVGSARAGTRWGPTRGCTPTGTTLAGWRSASSSSTCPPTTCTPRRQRPWS